MLYLEVQIFFALLLAVILGWLVTRLLSQNNERGLTSGNERLKVHNTSLQDTIKKQSNQLVDAADQLKSRDTSIETLAEEKRQLKSNVIGLEGDNTNLNTQLSTAHARQNETSQELKATITQRDGFKDRLNVYIQKKEIHDTQMISFNEEMERSRLQIQQLGEKQTELTSETMTLNFAKEDFHAQLRSTSTERDALKAQLESFAIEREDFQHKLRDADNKFAQTYNEVTMLTKERDTAVLKMEVVDQQIAGLNYQIVELTQERDEFRVRLFTVDELTSRITSPMKVEKKVLNTFENKKETV